MPVSSRVTRGRRRSCDSVRRGAVAPATVEFCMKHEGRSVGAALWLCRLSSIGNLGERLHSRPRPRTEVRGALRAAAFAFAPRGELRPRGGLSRRAGARRTGGSEPPRYADAPTRCCEYAMNAMPCHQCHVLHESHRYHCAIASLHKAAAGRDRWAEEGALCTKSSCHCVIASWRVPAS